MAWPSLSEVKAANWAHLRSNASYWTSLARTWEAAFTEIREAAKHPGGTEWTGQSAEKFQDRTDTDVITVRGPIDMLDNAAAIANRGADAQDANRRLVLDAVDEAQCADFTVAEDYTAKDARTDYSGPDEYFARKQAAIDHTDYIKFRVNNLVTNEDNIARQLATATADLREFGFGDEGFDGGAGSAEPRGLGAPPDDPTQFTQWWNQLSPDRKDAAYRHDHFIGNHPGMPFEDKSNYNKQHLPELIANAQADIDRLQASRDELALTPGGNLSTVTKLGVIDSQLQDAKRSLDGYRSVQQAMDVGSDEPPRFLGYLDDQGHAAVSIGNPDTATRNAILVPGTGQDLTAIDGATDKSLAMYMAAHDANSDLRDGDVAVTTWMAYDRPMALPEAAHTDYARNGAAGLDGFEAGMRASHVGAPSLDTVIGHSYGSTLVGAAATDGHHLAADNVIAVGSPGMLTGHAADLDLNPGAQVFAARADNDVIGLATGATLGPDPTAPAFGATRLDAAPGPPGPFDIPGISVKAHSSYWDDGNHALSDFGAVIAGVEPPYLYQPPPYALPPDIGMPR